MDDDKILALYRQRNEDAIYETDRKYGALLRSIARNILGDGAESHDCVNDTYLQVWNSIPPLLPKRFSAWLGRLVRNHAIDLWRGNRAQKRDCELTLLLEELDECLPSAQSVTQEVEKRELVEALNAWLATLSKEDRRLFLLRYWNGEPLKEIAQKHGVQPDKLARKMYRLRQSLRTALEKEGVLP